MSGCLMMLRCISLTKACAFVCVETKKGAQLTLKAANQDCAHLAPGVMPKGQGKCEYDDHGGHIAGALSLSRNVDATLAADLAAGNKPLASALSEAQNPVPAVRAGRVAAAGGLRALGPTQVSSYQLGPLRGGLLGPAGRRAFH